jgi:hypothetical protein
MIERNVNMATKKTNIEELEQQCLEAEKNFQALHEQLILAKKEEEEAKRVKLEAERKARYKEVVDAYENFEKLRSEYVDDYGCFTFKSENKTKNSHSVYWQSVGLL